MELYKKCYYIVIFAEHSIEYVVKFNFVHDAFSLSRDKSEATLFFKEEQVREYVDELQKEFGNECKVKYFAKNFLYESYPFEIKST
jgi:hypothetical protein